MGVDSQLVRDLLETYYHSLANGNANQAVTALHEDVSVVHVGVRLGDTFTVQDALEGAHHRINGSDEMEEFLKSRLGDDVEIQINDIRVDGQRAAFTATITDEIQGYSFVGWVRIEDERIRSYTVVPANIPLQELS
jgi:hypothetical protein